MTDANDRQESRADDEQDDSSMDALLDAAFENAAPTKKLEPGTSLDRYQLVEPIAQGGMGQVWLARDLGLSRDVALKVVLPERVSKRALDYFTREARAGGKLSHPNVVSTYAFGEDHGIAWIAQELAPGGRTVRDFLEEARHSAHEQPDYYRSVATLAAQIAEGLQAIHDAGVIHRDLKPANVLLAADGVAKITDFGLARLEDEVGLSVTGDLAGTWAYMSPEQVMAKRIGIDHRADIFSLGILMYELITQRRPFDGDTTAQLAQQIVYEDPPDIGDVRSQCPQDLAVICHKAIQKRRDERFQSAGEVALELRRHLDGAPIQTRPPGLLRRARHWIRRNPTKSTAAGVAAAAMAVVSWLAMENAQLADDERQQAMLARNNEQAAQAALTRSQQLLTERDAALEQEQERAEQLEQVTLFQAQQLEGLDVARMGQRLRADILAQMGAGATEADTAALDDVNFTDVALRSLRTTLFEPALRVLEAEFEDQPLVRAELLHTTAKTMMGAGLGDAAEAPQRRALQLRTELLGERHWDTLDSMVSAGNIQRLRGDLEAAEATYAGALRASREALGDDDEVTLRAMMELADCVMTRGRPAEATPLAREALRGYRRALGREHADAMLAARLLGRSLLRQGQLEEAAAIAKANLELARAQPSRGPRHFANYAEAYGMVLMEQGRYREAIELRRGTLDALREELGDEHHRTLASITNLATALRAAGDAGPAAELFREGLKTAARALGEGHPYTCSLREGLGSALRDLGELDEAEGLLRDALSIARRTRQEGDPGLQTAISGLGVLLKQRGKLDEAEQLYREVLALRKKTLGERHPATLISLGNLGALLRAKGSPDAEEHTRAAYEGMKALRGPDHPYTLLYEGNLAFLLMGEERYEDALELLGGHVQRCRATLGDAHNQTIGAVTLHARALQRSGDAPAARALLERFLEEASLPEGSKAAKHLQTGLRKLGG